MRWDRTRRPHQEDIFTSSTNAHKELSTDEQTSSYGFGLGASNLRVPVRTVAVWTREKQPSDGQMYGSVAGASTTRAPLPRFAPGGVLAAA
jgi:hypothetical protein